MRPFGKLAALDEARAALLALARPIERTEEVALAAAHERVLARDVVASFDVPGYDRSAMDGFAVRAADVARAPCELAVVDDIAAGGTPRRALGAGEAARIATGARLPDGADAVVRVEDTGAASESRVAIRVSVAAGEAVSRRGGDMRAGTRALAAGAFLSAERIAVLAALGNARVHVYARPRVVVVPTGNEIVSAGAPLPPGHLYDSNGPALAALFAACGADVVRLAPVADEFAALERVLDAHAPTADLLVFSGGSSVGERDLVSQLVAKRGEIKVHGVAVRPGKPLLIGHIGRAIVIGLPGNPASCLTNAHVFVRPALERVARRPAHASDVRRYRLGRAIASSQHRVFICPVEIRDGAARPTFKESGAVTSLADSQGYVLVPADGQGFAEGDEVDVVLW
ncbi:MAG: molybdopterin molybdotransferase MoeA [Thermoplasmatota archaeon]